MTSEDGLHRTNRIAKNGDAELYCESLEVTDRPNQSAPYVLLSEAEAPSTRWPQPLLHGLAALAGRVIWFDTRDVGRSTWMLEPYAMADLVDDVLAVLDAHGIEQAHLLGRSMGGEVAQHVALAAPGRVSSLVLVSTSPGRREEYGLPEQWFIDKMSDRLFVDPPGDAEGRARWIVEQLEWFSGSAFSFDRDAHLDAVATEAAEFWRGPNGHGLAVMEAPDIFERLATITAPSVIVHGTVDPVLPVAHGVALADALANAELHLVEGLGHELPASFVPDLLRLLAPRHG